MKKTRPSNNTPATPATATPPAHKGAGEVRIIGGQWKRTRLKVVSKPGLRPTPDRVRETFKKVRGLNTPQVLDHAITSTISRTIITHGSTQMMVLSMLLFGGETLHNFALALTIGICFGIYSSVLVACPLVMWLGASREHFIKVKKQIEGANADGAVV